MKKVILNGTVGGVNTSVAYEVENVKIHQNTRSMELITGDTSMYIDLGDVNNFQVVSNYKKEEKEEK